MTKYFTGLVTKTTEIIAQGGAVLKRGSEVVLFDKDESTDNWWVSPTNSNKVFLVDETQIEPARIKKQIEELDADDAERAKCQEADQIINNLNWDECKFLLHCLSIEVYDYEETWELREALSVNFADGTLTIEQLRNLEEDFAAALASN